MACIVTRVSCASYKRNFRREFRGSFQAEKNINGRVGIAIVRGARSRDRFTSHSTISGYGYLLIASLNICIELFCNGYTSPPTVMFFVVGLARKLTSFIKAEACCLLPVAATSGTFTVTAFQLKNLVGAMHWMFD